MSGTPATDLYKLTEFYFNNCPEYYDSIWAPLYVLADQFPTLVIIVATFAQLLHNEALWKIQGLLSYVTFFVSWGLRTWVAEPSPFPACSAFTNESPAYHAQKAVTLSIFTFGVMMLYRYRVSFTALLIMAFVHNLVIYTRLISGVNTPEQLAFGSLVGFAEGGLWVLGFYLFVMPQIDFWLETWLGRTLNLKNDYLIPHARREAIEQSKKEIERVVLKKMKENQRKQQTIENREFNANYRMRHRSNRPDFSSIDFEEEEEEETTETKTKSSVQYKAQQRQKQKQESATDADRSISVLEEGVL